MKNVKTKTMKRENINRENENSNRETWNSFKCENRPNGEKRLIKCENSHKREKQLARTWKPVGENMKTGVSLQSAKLQK